MPFFAQKRMIKSIFLPALVVCMLSFTVVLGQGAPATPTVLNISGGSAQLANVTYEWSVGEMILVETAVAQNLTVTNGFLQPLKVLDASILNGFNIVPNNILSPNNDGENETWVIENIEQYPENEVTVYDRAGRIVFQAVNYKNTWTGVSNNLPLNQDTYYYILKLKKADTVGLKKGYLTIIR